MEMHDKEVIQLKCEQLFEWRKWAGEIPFIKFPASWHVRIIPPYANAVVRFNVIRDDQLNTNDFISIYLDCYDRLGHMGKPYWEAYCVEDECVRFLLGQEEQLIAAIDAEFDRRASVLKPDLIIEGIHDGEKSIISERRDCIAICTTQHDDKGNSRQMWSYYKKEEYLKMIGWLQD